VLAVLLAGVVVALLVVVTRNRQIATQNVHLRAGQGRLGSPEEARRNRREPVQTASNPLPRAAGDDNTFEDPSPDYSEIRDSRAPGPPTAPRPPTIVGFDDEHGDVAPPSSETYETPATVGSDYEYSFGFSPGGTSSNGA
jgi:hypothetical protein